MPKSNPEREQAIASLREILPPGSTVWTVLRHVSRSGMSRRIDAYVIEDGQPRWISGLVAKASGLRLKDDALMVSGCGMDMGFGVVYELSHALYPAGFECTGERCNSNDHSNGDRSREPHHHHSGGYALRQRWQ